MKKFLKKGFTIVELVIVIAVIAILTAVLIPTISSVTHKAQISADTQLVRNLNTALKEDEALNGAPKTMQGALDVAAADGYDLAKINAKARDNEILWDSVNNVFAYRKDGEIVYTPDVLNRKDVDPDDYWIISKDVDNTYSTYYVGDSAVVETDKSFETKKSNVASILYSNTGTKRAIICTDNTNVKVTIYAPNSSVYHYGNADTVNINAVKMGSYHENGSVVTINVKAGKVLVEESAFVGEIGVDKDATSATVEVVNDGTIFNAKVVEYEVSTDNRVATVTAPATETTNDIVDNETTGLKKKVTDINSKLSIGTAEALINLANAHSQGIISGVLDIVLTDNINLTGKVFVPFGLNVENAFQGTIDGNGKTIRGLSFNESVRSRITTFSSISDEGTPFALIAYAEKNITIKNLTIEADINVENGEAVAAFIGVYNNLVASSSDNAKYTLKLDHCTSKGSITSSHKVAGFIGTGFITQDSVDASKFAYKYIGPNNIRANTDIIFDTCVNEANITANRPEQNKAKVGGFASGLPIFTKQDNKSIGGSTVKIIGNCVNKGAIYCSNDVKYKGSFTGYLSGNSASDCVLECDGSFTDNVNTNLSKVYTNNATANI